MKKIFCILLGISLLSCSGSNDDITNTAEEVQEANSQPDKGYAFYVDSPFTPIGPDNYYKFTYNNGNLTRISGKNGTVAGTFVDTYTALSYQGNQVTVEYSWASSLNTDHINYTMKDGRPIEAEYRRIENNMPYYTLYQRKFFTYENNTIKVSIWRKGVVEEEEAVVTYSFNNNQNLAKSEKLEKRKGKPVFMTTTIYSDFDKAKNPFKKFGLVNDILYEKSLSVNNFRKSESTQTIFMETTNPTYTSTGVNFYKYDSKGQVLLYYPL
ncbi:hypothetical protein [Chryseobacterium sp. SIMBA_028]|uniref:hypothetical protein n=1 Tax=Chryseobacterium sp. SIMBA_028 TaxID=3085771 RepID=UPI00397928A5